jgi:hypothetical protein
MRVRSMTINQSKWSMYTFFRDTTYMQRLTHGIRLLNEGALKDKLRDAIRHAQLCNTLKLTIWLLTLYWEDAPWTVQALHTECPGVDGHWLASLAQHSWESKRLTQIGCQQSTQEWSVCELWKARSSKLAGSNQDCETITCKYGLWLLTSYLGYHNLKYPKQCDAACTRAAHCFDSSWAKGKSPEQLNEKVHISKADMEWMSKTVHTQGCILRGIGVLMCIYIYHI